MSLPAPWSTPSHSGFAGGGVEMQRASFSFVWLAIATLFLAGCGGNDGEQRAAFVGFLQTRVLDKPGIHVARLTDEERSQFGPYADDYAIITDFNKAMDESVSPKMTAAMRAGSIRSIQDLVTSRDKLQTAKAGIAAMDSALTGELARADAARTKLNQPADVKEVYDKAYDRLVTEPAAAFKDIVPVMDKVLGEAIGLGEYLDSHRSSVRLSGSMIQTDDPAARAAINDKLQSLQSHQQAVRSAQGRLQAVAFGRPR